MKNEINYDKIDKNCINLIKFFNSVGLKTKFSCQGHNPTSKFYIMFDDSVTDEDINKFLIKYDYTDGHVYRFLKWTRNCQTCTIEDNIISNWLFEINTGSNIKNQIIASKSYEWFMLVNNSTELSKTECYKKLLMISESRKKHKEAAK